MLTYRVNLNTQFKGVVIKILLCVSINTKKKRIKMLKRF